MSEQHPLTSLSISARIQRHFSRNLFHKTRQPTKRDVLNSCGCAAGIPEQTLQPRLGGCLLMPSALPTTKTVALADHQRPDRSVWQPEENKKGVPKPI